MRLWVTRQVLSRFCGYLLMAWEQGQELSGFFFLLLFYFEQELFILNSKCPPIPSLLLWFPKNKHTNSLKEKFPFFRTICFRKTRNETGDYRSFVMCKQPFQHPWSTVDSHFGKGKMTSRHTFQLSQDTRFHRECPLDYLGRNGAVFTSAYPLLHHWKE